VHTLVRHAKAYLVRWWFWYVTGIAFLLATNWLAVQIPLELADGVDALRDGDQPGVHRAALVIALMGLSVIVVRTLSRVLIFTPGRLVEYQVKNDLFAHLTRLPPAFFGRLEAGDIVSRATNDITYVRVLSGFGVLSLFNVTSALVLTGWEMVALSWRLTLWVVLPIALALVGVQAGIRLLFTLVKQAQEELSELSAHILASLQGVTTIQGFGAEEAFVGRFLDRNQAYLATTLRLARIQAFVLPLLTLGGSAAVFALLAVGGPMTIEGELSVGQLVAFVTYVGYLLMPLRGLGWMLTIFQRGRASLERVHEIMDADPERSEGDSPAPMPAIAPPSIAISGLSFAYPDAPDERVLHDISCALPGGSLVGVFGPTGSGKSTLLRLLARSYNPPESSVFVDGTDLTALDLLAWRRRISMAPQTPFLFSETLADNVVMGVAEPERLARALERASLGRDLELLPEGQDTVVGQRGVMLSGGQRQRTALARALYRDFDLLLLDDVLSAVDHATEQRIVDALVEEVSERGASGVVVSHRMSVLARCDKILVLDDGRLVATGTHQDLTDVVGPYRDAWLASTTEPAAEPVEEAG